MCEHGNTTPVLVLVPAELSHTGEERFDRKPVDSCIAEIVEALNEKEVWTRCSCCGHGKDVGEIDLEDGRCLLVLDKETDKMVMLERDMPELHVRRILKTKVGRRVFASREEALKAWNTKQKKDIASAEERINRARANLEEEIANHWD